MGKLTVGKGDVVLTRRTGNNQKPTIVFEMKDFDSGVFITVEMTPEQWAFACTGQVTPKAKYEVKQ